MRVAEWLAPERIGLARRSEPEADIGQAVIEVSYCGICGSDLHSFHSGFAAKPGQVLGHEFTGHVLTAPGVRGLSEGDRVTVRPLIPCGECPACRQGALQLCTRGYRLNIGYGSPGAFAQRVLVPRAVVGQTIFPLPDEIDDRAGALVEPLAVALHAVNLADVHPGDEALVFGAGPIGLGVTHLLKRAGAMTMVAEPSPLRREAALRYGADRVLDPLGTDVVQAARERTGPGAFGLGAAVDVVVDCAGAPAGFAAGLKAVAPGGTIVLTALYKEPIPVRPDRIVEKEVRIQGAISYRDEFAEVIEILRAGEFDASGLISHTYALEQIAEAFATQGDARRSLKVLVQP